MRSFTPVWTLYPGLTRSLAIVIVIFHPCIIVASGSVLEKLFPLTSISFAGRNADRLLATLPSSVQLRLDGCRPFRITPTSCSHASSRSSISIKYFSVGSFRIRYRTAIPWTLKWRFNCLGLRGFLPMTRTIPFDPGTQRTSFCALSRASFHRSSGSSSAF